MAPRKKKQRRPRAPDGRPYSTGELVCVALAMQAPLEDVTLEKMLGYVYEQAFKAAADYAVRTGDRSILYDLHCRSWTLTICGVLGQRLGVNGLGRLCHTPHPDPLGKRRHKANLKAFKEVCGGTDATHFILPESFDE